MDLRDDRSSASNRFVDVIPDQPKIESKDHMWKPAPIMGRDFAQKEVSEPEVNRPAYNSAALRSEPLRDNYLLPQ